MPTCTARYRCRLIGGNRSDGEAVVRFLEEREPDEWGDPGRLVRRRLRKVEGPHAESWEDRLNTRLPNWRLRLVERIGPVEWADGQGL